MESYILLGTATTPTGRGLLQEGNEIFVLSACCTSKYAKTGLGAICDDCGKHDTGTVGWRVDINLREKWTKDQEQWAKWGKNLFGYEDFALHIKG